VNLAQAKLLSFDWAGAEQEFKEALQSAPNDAQALGNYSALLAALGRWEESFSMMKKALELHPNSIDLYIGFGQLLLFARQYDHAIEQARKVLELAPKNYSAHLGLAWAYTQKSMYPEALSELDIAEETGGMIQQLRISVEGLRAVIFAKMGQRQEAEHVLDMLLKSPSQPDLPYVIAQVYLALGNTDSGFEWLNRSYEQRDSSLLFLKCDPGLDNVRSDPRYVELSKKMKLQT